MPSAHLKYIESPLFVILLGILLCQCFPISYCWAESLEILEASKAPHIDIDPNAPSSPFDGKIIRNVEIKLADVFENGNLPTFYRTVNDLKISTQYQVISKEVLLKEGKEYSDFLRKESERRLRELRYLRRIQIIPRLAYDPSGNFVDVNCVDVTVYVQDTWTLIPQVSYSSSSGKRKYSAGISESNLMGLGKRVELAYQNDESRDIFQAVYDDNRFNGKRERLLTAWFDREDGEEGVFFFGRPYRTLIDPFSWYVNIDHSNIVGRLFEDGDEDYIFREKKEGVNLRYSVARGNPDKMLRRFTLGYDYLDDSFDQADLDDYKDLNLDPSDASNDPARLAADRRFTGPVIAYEFIEPQFVSMNYIDRFERIEDYNLGNSYDMALTMAPDILGSINDTLLLSFNGSTGWLFDEKEFFRIEGGLASRLNSDGFENSLMRGEAKYYSVLGELEIGDLFLGRHTLAASFFLDYGSDLDRDRQFTLGGDNFLRGYRARAFTGDKRSALNIEDRMHFIDDLYRLVSIGAAAFVDVGGATNDSLRELYSDQLYADFGVGLRFGFPRSTGGRILRVDLAIPVREADDGTDSLELRLSIAGGQVFSSRLRSESFGPERANVEVGFDR